MKIADFGSAKILNQINTPYVVSKYYRAPELFFGVSDYKVNIDVWSFGVILYEFLMQKVPFKSKFSKEGNQLMAIFKGLGLPSKEIKKNLLKECQNIK